MCLAERDEIGDKGGYFDQRLVTTVNLVEEPLRGDTWHGLLACRIDGQEDGAVGDGERRGKAIDQVVGATVEMRLEAEGQVTPCKELSYGMERCTDLVGMMGVVVHDDEVGALDVEVKATLGSAEALQSLAQFIFGAAIEPTDGEGCRGIVHIDGCGDTGFEVAEDVLSLLDDKVEEDGAVADADIGGIEVGEFAIIEPRSIRHDVIFGIAHFGIRSAIDLDATMFEQQATRTDEFGEMGERLAISLFGAVDVEVVGIARSDDGHIGRKRVERMVELVGLDGNQVALVAEHEVAVVRLEDATEEGVAIDMALLEQMGYHRTGGSLAVGASYTESALLARDDAEQLAALHHLEAVLLEPTELAMVLGDGGRIANNARGRILEGRIDGIDIVFEMNVDAFADEGIGEW